MPNVAAPKLVALVAAFAEGAGCVAAAVSAGIAADSVGAMVAG